MNDAARTSLNLSLTQQRDMLRALLANVEMQLQPRPAAAESSGPLNGMTWEESSSYERKMENEHRLPIIEIDANGIATLSNIDYQDLRSLLTSASLYRREHPFKREPIVPSGVDPTGEDAQAAAVANHEWHVRMTVLGDLLNGALTYGLEEHNAKLMKTSPHLTSSTYSKRRRLFIGAST